MNDAEKLIDLLLTYYNVTSVSQLADVINIGQPALSKWKKNNSVSAIKKKCRELGIYNEIFGDTNTFTQHGTGNQQIGTQNNRDSSYINNLGGADIKTQNIDDDILKLVEALNSVANALNKKQELKSELTKLISTLPTL